MVKCGWSVTDEEAANQEFAHKYSNSADLKVPKIFRYFRKQKVGYIVMEYISGISLEKVAFDLGLIRRLAPAIHNFFQRIPVDFPGPRNRGIPRGYLFSEYGAGATLDSMFKLNEWLNERLMLNNEPGFDFDLSDCGFCHLDLARRNIIICSDGSFCLLDWEHAGVYPIVFETYCLLFNRLHDYQFSQWLFEALDDISSRDLENRDKRIQMLDRVYRNNMRYAFFNMDHIALRKEAEQFTAFPFPLNTEVSTSMIPPPPPPPPPALPTETIPVPSHQV